MSEPYKDGYMLVVEQIAQLTADLTQAQARADALAVENAELREGLLVELADAIANVRRLTNRMPPEVVDSYLHSPRLERLRALLTADPAQRGAEIIASADAMAAPFPSIPGQRLAACRICRVTWLIGQPERHQDIEYGVPCPVVAYRRLRGGRVPENGDE